MANESVSVSELVGRNLRRIREERGERQEDIAQLVGKVGLPWSRATVAAVELGRRTVQLEEFLALAFVLEESPADLLLGEEHVSVGEGRFPAEGLALLLSGPPDDVVDTVFTIDLDSRLGVAPTEAEQNVARIMNLTTDQLAEVAITRWGRSFTEERDRRAAERTRVTEASLGDDDFDFWTSERRRHLQAVRGRVSRELIHELTESEDKEND